MALTDSFAVLAIRKPSTPSLLTTLGKMEEDITRSIFSMRITGCVQHDPGYGIRPDLILVGTKRRICERAAEYHTSPVEVNTG